MRGLFKYLWMFLTVFFAFCSVDALAQDCYNSTRQQGISCYNDGDYSIAIDCFEAARLCPDKPVDNDLDTWISKCRTKIQDEQRAAAEAEARRKQQQLASKAFMDIRRLSFWNEDADNNRLPFGEAKDLRYLQAAISYNGLSDVAKTLELKIKIINPDGKLRAGSSSPDGYTFVQNVTVKPGENVISLLGFGNKNAGTYVPGTYRYEVWYNGNKLYGQNFTLTGTSGATTLTVDRRTALTVSLDEDGGYRSFTVSTDGDSYDVTLLPSWCSVTNKTATAFTIKYSANNTGSPRSDWFRVVSGDQTVRVDVSQDASGPSAEIENIWVDHNFYRDNVKGMLIHVHFSVYDMKGREDQVTVYFYNDSSGEPLRDLNDSHCTGNGEVATYEYYTPLYDGSEYSDFTIFMPYSEFHLYSGEYDLKFYVVIWGGDSKLAESDWQYFTYTKN